MLDEDALKRFEHVEAVLAIQKLKHTYWHYNDTGLRGDKVAQLFTEDGVWSNAELGHYEGREAIRTFFNGASELIPFCAHVGMNEIIDIDGDSAQAKWRCLLTCTLVDDGKEASRVILLDYRDDFTRIDGRWLIKKLAIMFNFNVDYANGWAGVAKVREGEA